MNHALENWNYANDARTKGPAEKPVLYLENGDEIELPMHWAVCPVCEGEGKHVNPSIDAGGLTIYDDRGDYEPDPEFLEDYMGGVYDQTCNRCEGKRVVPEVAWNAMTDEDQEAYKIQLEAERECEAEQLAEIRMGC